MGDPKYTCPLCCNKTFSNKQSLQTHLSDILQNLYCPICKNKWASLVHLIEHLNLDNCQPEETEHTIVFNTCTQGGKNESTSEIPNSNVTEIEHLDHSDSDQFSSNTLATSANNEMYVEFLSKQFSKPCLQTQSLKLVRDPDEQRESYFVVTQDNAELSVGHTIVTKQNKDGTISLTAVKDMKIETVDPLISQSENDVEDSQAEIYSCNTCGVSFSSVLDHIQNYHNDQEVVVEEPIEEGENDAIPIEYDNIDQDPLTLSDKQAPRRVITDTGDIVEAPLVTESISELQSQQIVPTNLKVEEVTDNEGRVYTRRYVQIEKLCDSVIKDIKETDDKGGGPYHKVVLKEVKNANGTNVKMYNCMSCNIFVSTLNEFKAHPCKTLKYKCLHCPVAYENSKSLCAHMKVHKLKTEGNTKLAGYECEVCSTVFPSNKSLKLHKRMHDPIKARPIEPPLVNRFGKEPSKGRYCCPTCDKMIPIDYKVIHQNSHKTSNKMNCQICNKKFSSEEYLDMHMTVHNIDKVAVNKQDKSLPYNCLYCNRRFARPHEKVKHERIHTGEKPHSCEICGKSFRVSYCLTLHMRTHTGARPYACPHCGKRFKAHSVFNHHLLTHSDVRAYKCPYCPKAFKTSVQLAGHKNSHTKPFSCLHCNRPFASLYAVRVHTETHARQNNLKFSCSLCGASYARAFALKDHVKQIHKQDIESIENLGGVKEADWIIRENTDNARTLETTPSLPTEINDNMGLSSNELIIP